MPTLLAHTMIQFTYVHCTYRYSSAYNLGGRTKILGFNATFNVESECGFNFSLLRIVFK